MQRGSAGLQDELRARQLDEVSASQQGSTVLQTAGSGSGASLQLDYMAQSCTLHCVVVIHTEAVACGCNLEFTRAAAALLLVLYRQPYCPIRLHCCISAWVTP